MLLIGYATQRGRSQSGLCARNIDRKDSQCHNIGMDVKTAAQKLKMTPASVSKLLRTGKLDGILRGRVWEVNDRAVEERLKRKEWGELKPGPKRDMFGGKRVADEAREFALDLSDLGFETIEAQMGMRDALRWKGKPKFQTRTSTIVRIKAPKGIKTSEEMASMLKDIHTEYQAERREMALAAERAKSPTLIEIAEGSGD